MLLFSKEFRNWKSHRGPSKALPLLSHYLSIKISFSLLCTKLYNTPSHTHTCTHYCTTLLFLSAEFEEMKEMSGNV